MDERADDTVLVEVRPFHPGQILQLYRQGFARYLPVLVLYFLVVWLLPGDGRDLVAAVLLSGPLASRAERITRGVTAADALGLYRHALHAAYMVVVGVCLFLLGMPFWFVAAILEVQHAPHAAAVSVLAAHVVLALVLATRLWAGYAAPWIDRGGADDTWQSCRWWQRSWALTLLASLRLTAVRGAFRRSTMPVYGAAAAFAGSAMLAAAALDHAPWLAWPVRLGAYFVLLPLLNLVVVDRAEALREARDAPAEDFVERVPRPLLVGGNALVDWAKQQIVRGAERRPKGTPAQRLERAVLRGDAGAVREALAAGATADHVRDSGTPAILTAARSGHTAVVAQLLDAGARIEAADPSGNTALLGAAQGGHAATVQLLLERGAHAGAADVHGRTALGIACEVGAGDVFDLLVTEVSASDMRGATGDALMAAAAHGGCVPILERLLDHGAQVTPLAHAADARRLPIVVAVEAGHAEAIRFLATHGADAHLVLSHGRSLLHLAAAAGRVDSVRALLDLGLSPGTRDDSGATPADDARFIDADRPSDRHREIVGVLEQAAAQPTTSQS